jgi:hypothetical protein
MRKVAYMVENEVLRQKFFGDVRHSVAGNEQVAASS